VIKMKNESVSVKNMQKKSGKELVFRLVTISLILGLLLIFPAGSIWGSADDAINIVEIIENAKAWENVGLSYIGAGEWELAAAAYTKAASYWKDAQDWSKAAGACQIAASCWEGLNWSMAAKTWAAAAYFWSKAAMKFQDWETYRDVVSYSEKKDREAEAWVNAASCWKKAGEWNLAAQAYENAASYWNSTISRMRAIDLWWEAAFCWCKAAEASQGLNWSKAAEAWQSAAWCLKQVFEWNLAAQAYENAALCWAIAGEPGKESEARGNAYFCRNEAKV
jgi:tetratricopeptide (TPR) repeat protein